jgi:hypothetical protein
VIVDVRRWYVLAIDVGKDRLIEARPSTDRARKSVESFERFIEEHKDEITALQILYSRPSAQRLTFKEVKELALRSAARRTSGRPRSCGPRTRRSTARRCEARARAC